MNNPAQKLKNIWTTWTILEALAKMLAKMLQKLVGAGSVLFAHALLATAIIGLVQTVLGTIGATARKQPLLTKRSHILGACGFGVLAFVATILGFTVFLPHFNGEVGVVTFIVTLSIVPGALIDSLVFGRRFNKRKIIGLLIAVVAGYSVLGWPTLNEALHLPAWVWLSFGIMAAVTVNQWITQSIKDIDPFVKNFWGGLTTLVLCLLSLLCISSLEVVVPTSSLLQRIYLFSSLCGVIVVGMWCFNLISYKTGASIALKKLVMNGTYLSVTMLAGILFFDETATLSKAIGVALYLTAFTIMDDKTWQFLFSEKKT